MYQRSAIVLEKYFNKLFGHDQKYNLKDNFLKYSRLVECSANYKEATDSEDKIMQEYDEIASRIKNIQNKQEILSEKNEKFQEERETIFQNIAEEPDNIKKLIDNIDRNIDETYSEIKQNEQDFIKVIYSFSEKSDIRNNLGKQRKKVEEEYSNALNEALEVYKNIDKENLNNARDYNDNCAEIEKELTKQMKENGEKEKVPFDNNAIKSAIQLEINIQKKEIEILYNIYEKTGRLFLEIKNNNVKIERHKKLIKDIQAKISFLDALKDYLVQFLDNERLTAVNGEMEHRKQMREACKNFEEDLVQINNMYELLLREISAKANKKMYKELYNIQYLKNLEQQAENFEIEISKLNLLGTIIDPNHWRLEGMTKIYHSFYKTVTDSYERNLSEFEMEDKKEKIAETQKEESINDEVNLEKNEETSKEKNNNNELSAKEERELYLSNINKNIDFSEEDLEYNDTNGIKYNTDKENEEDDEEDEEDEFDERIDMILGFDKKETKINDNNKKSFRELDRDDEILGKEEENFWNDDDDEDLEEYDDWEEENDMAEEDFGEENEFDDEDFDEDDYENEYEDENLWDEENPIEENTETNKKNNYSIDTKNKKVKGKHNKDGEKPKGLLGKFMK